MGNHRPTVAPPVDLRRPRRHLLLKLLILPVELLIWWHVTADRIGAFTDTGFRPTRPADTAHCRTGSRDYSKLKSLDVSPFEHRRKYPGVIKERRSRHNA
jgi:hypothetical protein